MHTILFSMRSYRSLFSFGLDAIDSYVRKIPCRKISYVILYIHIVYIIYNNINPIGTYCKKFKRTRYNREAISVKAVWLSGTNSEERLGCVRNKERPDISVVINCLHYISS